MRFHRAILAAAVLLASVVGAGCMGPEEDPAETVQQTETTPGDTVEAGATPTEVTSTPTVFETAEDEENATDGGSDGEPTEEGDEADEGEEGEG